MRRSGPLVIVPREGASPEQIATITAWNERAESARAEGDVNRQAALAALVEAIETFIEWRTGFVLDLPEEVSSKERDRLKREFDRRYRPVKRAREQCVQARVRGSELTAAFKPLGKSRYIGLPGLEGYVPPPVGGLYLRGSFAMQQTARVAQAVEDYGYQEDDEGED